MISKPLCIGLLSLVAALSACGKSASSAEEAPKAEETPTKKEDEVNPARTSAEIKHGRLLVHDKGAKSLRLIELADGKTLMTIPLETAKVAIETTHNGRYGVIVERDRGNAAENISPFHRVRFLDSGVVLDSHGDHVHYEKEKPQLLELALTGTALNSAMPAHVTSYNGHVAIHFDGTHPGSSTAETPPEHQEAVGVVVSEDGLDKVTNDKLMTFRTDANHGVTLAGHGELIIQTVPPERDAASSLPSSVKIMKESGETTQTFPNEQSPDTSCPGLHGATSVQNSVLFGCKDGVLFLSWDADKKLYTAKKLSGLETDRRIGSFLTTPDSKQTFAVSSIKGKEVQYHRMTSQGEALNSVKSLSQPEGICASGVNDSGIWFLKSSGVLAGYSAADFSPLAEIKVQEGGFKCEGDGAVIPGFVLNKQAGYISLGESGKVIEVNFSLKKVERTLNIGGNPQSLSLFHWGSEAPEGHDH